MINPIRHYALENPATVYDEESLTVLELVARLAGKVNECVSAENVIMTHIDVLNELVKSGKLTATGLIPSGDVTGNTDRRNMQTMLDTLGVCPLGAGTFYINEPLDMHAGNVLTGKGVSATKIRVERGDGFFHTGNADHLTFRDFTLDGDGNTTGVGFHFRGTTNGEYNGVRYSTFENVDVNGFAIGAVLCGVWCSTFKHCRFILTEGGEYCVKQEGTCNNNVYEHCMFIGNETGTGVFISAEGGAQNCGNTFTDCDFEKLAVAIRGYSAVSLNVQNIYAEGVGVVFQLDSCPNFNAKGGYVAYIDRLCNINVSNAAALYQGKGGTIADIFCTVNDGCEYLITGKDPTIYTMRVENVRTANGNVFVFDRDRTQAYGYGGDYVVHTVYSDYAPANEKQFRTYTPAAKMGEEFKVIGAWLQAKNSFPANDGGTTVLKTNHSTTHQGYDVNIGTLYLENKTYAAGEKIQFEITDPLRNVATEFDFYSYPYHIYGASSDTVVEMRLILEVAVGNMIV